MPKVRHTYNLRTRKVKRVDGEESMSKSNVNLDTLNQALANANLTKNIVKAKDNDLLNQIVENKNVSAIFRKRMRRKLWDSPFGFANVDSMLKTLVEIECDWATLLEFVEPKHKLRFSVNLQSILEP